MNDAFAVPQPLINPFNLRYERFRQRLAARRLQKNRGTTAVSGTTSGGWADAPRRHLDLFPTLRGLRFATACAPIGARLKRSRCRRSAIAALTATTAANYFLSPWTGERPLTSSERPMAVAIRDAGTRSALARQSPQGGHDSHGTD
jgi:hypothetical protein